MRTPRRTIMLAATALAATALASSFLAFPALAAAEEPRTLDEISIKATLDATWRPSGVWAARSRRFVYRCGPVPHTSFRSRGSYYRSPHTNATRVAEAAATADAFDPDLELEPRFAARVARLSKHVTAWADVPRCRDRSWKRQRLTRWR